MFNFNYYLMLARISIIQAPQNAGALPYEKKLYGTYMSKLYVKYRGHIIVKSMSHICILNVNEVEDI